MSKGYFVSWMLCLAAINYWFPADHPLPPYAIYLLLGQIVAIAGVLGWAWKHLKPRLRTLPRYRIRIERTVHGKAE